PNPAGDSVLIQFTFGSGSTSSAVDSLHLRTSELHFAGPATATVVGSRVVIRASVMPERTRTRTPSQPFAAELQAVMRGGEMIGVATIHQRFTAPSSSFDAIGRFEARRAAAPS